MVTELIEFIKTRANKEYPIPLDLFCDSEIQLIYNNSECEIKEIVIDNMIYIYIEK